MKCILFFLFSLTLLLSSTESRAQCIWPIKHPHYLFIGPEIYHLKRMRKGGSKQTGWLYGGKTIYERYKRCGFYWVLEGYYSLGRITGSTASGKRLKSDLTDREIEGRLGYSFCIRKWRNLTLTPYGGYGYFYSKNDFHHPSPLPCEFHNRFNYGSAGLAAAICLTPSLEATANIKAKFMLKGKSRVKDDPDYNNVTLQMNNETQYEVEAPLRYYTCCRGWNIVASIAPFYRFRHYGGHANYPFDFIDTKFHIYGGRVLFHLTF
ncbi:MAG: hypothetical protein ACE5GN_03825 [Waddliaceae bacterium]